MRLKLVVEITSSLRALNVPQELGPAARFVLDSDSSDEELVETRCGRYGCVLFTLCKHQISVPRCHSLVVNYLG